ncbi:Oidioi.mRNA.OKI2018_I69.YSR.g17063.t1.cds [Oikopleura dioica]|uniref:Oidioi.mRNA.OKI2018_I69.YSR.g17063.t1.cds n=1 Tax=Oikopleura dioica TaxID=34765 RepID=A0ABN7SN61_OIKDI|nr:Oidioi.mRNA.OKI2018_I69.YSR.g17063.t1.cds [Oikopleura dioica]
MSPPSDQIYSFFVRETLSRNQNRFWQREFTLGHGNIELGYPSAHWGKIKEKPLVIKSFTELQNIQIFDGDTVFPESKFQASRLDTVIQATFADDIKRCIQDLTEALAILVDEE